LLAKVKLGGDPAGEASKVRCAITLNNLAVRYLRRQNLH